MSFRELRSFTETMRLLGYPNLISMESFRTPNVELVADCLFWLVKRYEPSAEIVYEIERDADRVFFFKQICEVALSKARVKLQIKELYQSDGNAVREMLVLANVLKSAMNATEAEEPDHAGLQQMVAQRNVQDVKRVQQLCSDLTSDGSSLFFLIEEEISKRTERQRVLSRATEVGEFERRLREVLNSVGKQVEQLQSSIANLGADETTLEQKIESKKTQLERAQKRLKSLMAVRPAFMEEYEKHESDMQSQFVVYLEQYRNLEYLEHELAKFNAAEDALLEEHETKLRVMRERLRKEELNALRGEAMRARGGHMRNGSSMKTKGFGGNDDDDDDDDDDDNGPSAVSGGRGPSRGRVRNALDDGSSVSDTSDGSAREAPLRPPEAFGRPRVTIATSNDSTVRRTNDGFASGRGPGGDGDGSSEADEASARVADFRKSRMDPPSGTSGYDAIGIARSGGLSDDDDESETEDDSDSEIDSSDISIDSDDSDDSSDI